jgi:hypothetical protein
MTLSRVVDDKTRPGDEDARRLLFAYARDAEHFDPDAMADGDEEAGLLYDDGTTTSVVFRRSGPDVLVYWDITWSAASTEPIDADHSRPMFVGKYEIGTGPPAWDT